MVGVEDHDVVDIAPEDDAFGLAAVCLVDEDARVGVAACEALLDEPAEECTLEAAAGLNEAVEWFADLPADVVAVCVCCRLTRGGAGVDAFAVFESAL